MTEPVRGPGKAPFHQYLSQLRSRTGNSHRDVANRCGVQRSKVREWEAGESIPDPTAFRKLCGMFHELGAYKAWFQTQCDSMAALMRRRDYVHQDIQGREAIGQGQTGPVMAKRRERDALHWALIELARRDPDLVVDGIDKDLTS